MIPALALVATLTATPVPHAWRVTVTATETATPTRTATPDCCKLGGHEWKFEFTQQSWGVSDGMGWSVPASPAREVCRCSRCRLVNENISDCSTHSIGFHFGIGK